jgi:hypothetical protein
MQEELAAEGTPVEIDIVGLNERGQESANGMMSQLGVLPWLQDTEEEDAWGQWEATWRDVVILDERNVRQAVYNLTEHNLANDANYDSLKALLTEIAGD